MQEEKVRRSSVKNITKTVLALKAARIGLGLSRPQAAAKCSCSVRAFEQLENGRCNYTEERIRRLVSLMGMKWDEFKRIEASPEKALSQIDAYNLERTLARRPRRNLFKIITKEARVIRTLRKRRGISQDKASELCNFSHSYFGLIEAGRTDLTEEKIDLIVHALGFKRSEFNKLVAAKIIPDEATEEINGLLHLLDENALQSILAMIKALTKK
jgi:transcriptional regulator with XRE-family HTH domain